MALNLQVCPLCKKENECGMANGLESCWCFNVIIAENILEKIPEEAKNRACICRQCAEDNRESK